MADNWRGGSIYIYIYVVPCSTRRKVYSNSCETDSSGLQYMIRPTLGHLEARVRADAGLMARPGMA